LSASASPETPWYTQTWFVVLLLFFFFPAGLILMWTQTTWHIALKWVVSFLPVVWILLFVALVFSLTGETGEDVSQSDPTFIPVETLE
jgi:hypothetical protein